MKHKRQLTENITLKSRIVKEVPITEQLSKSEMECVYRHLKMFVKIIWDKKDNVPDACIGCNHYCSEDKQVLNPWPAFYNLANLSEFPIVVHKEHLNKQGNARIDL